MELTPEQQKQIAEQKQHCPFCQIVAGKIPSKKVYEDEYIIAVLDINPATPGHVLVMPKEHYPIMPVIPPDTFTHLFGKIPALSAYLRKAMVSSHCSVFIANGAAAGQQAMHFLVHLIPSDKPLAKFSLPSRAHDAAEVQQAGDMLAHNLPIMLRDRSPLFPLHPASPPSDLAHFIDAHPELKKAIMENPDAVVLGLQENPSLQPLFAGVDVHALSRKLNELASLPESAPIPSDVPVPVVHPGATVSEVVPPASSPEVPDAPRAVDLSDAALLRFLTEKPRLRELLLDDMETLLSALPDQPRLQHFFADTTPDAVRARVVTLTRPARRFGGDDDAAV